MTKCVMYRVIMHCNCNIKFSEPKAIAVSGNILLPQNMSISEQLWNSQIEWTLEQSFVSVAM